MYDLSQEIPSLSLDAALGVNSISGPPEHLPTFDPELHYFPFNDRRIPTPFNVDIRFPSSPLKQFDISAKKMRECETTPVMSFNSIITTTNTPLSSARHLLVVRGRIADKNPFHSLVMDPKLFCTYLYTSVHNADITVDLYIEDEYFPSNLNTLAILEALLIPNGGSIYTPSSPPPPSANYHVIEMQRRAISSTESLTDILSKTHLRHFVSTFPLWGSWGFELGRVHNPSISNFADVVKANLNVEDWGLRRNEDDEGFILVLDRETDRLLGGYRAQPDGKYEWGRQAFVIEALKARGLPVRSIAFNSSVPTRDIVSTVAKAKIMIGVHGAGLTHAMWMKKGSTLVEIINRIPDYYGRIPDTRGYHKSDFANLARSFGLRYFYKDSKAIMATHPESFNWEMSLLDVEEFADQIYELYT